MVVKLKGQQLIDSVCLRIINKYDLPSSVRWKNEDLDELIDTVKKITVENCAVVCEAETELPGPMPNALWAKLRKANMEKILRNNVSALKKSIAKHIRELC